MFSLPEPLNQNKRDLFQILHAIAHHIADNYPNYSIIASGYSPTFNFKAPNAHSNHLRFHLDSTGTLLHISNFSPDDHPLTTLEIADPHLFPLIDSFLATHQHTISTVENPPTHQ